VSFGSGSAVLDEVAAFVRRYIVLSSAARGGELVDRPHARRRRARDHACRHICGEEPGKTSRLELLALLVAALADRSVTAATLAKDERDRPTLLLAESAAFGGINRRDARCPEQRVPGQRFLFALRRASHGFRTSRPSARRRSPGSYRLPNTAGRSDRFG
jgi:hypothetical protein